ncbi:MAG: hypothetical protein AVDCRST_MAG96-162 [uncultured Segetibacter sp.]|uniref:Uncharacterized protein n=1 Tax=uncultured Segetibacter sp. TaxID=481133 RepID=A0A6J4RJJ8_9BACT|nr:MAG: hypothetical protein AVDCRST_MAG96-162 [uncultured Segetibacter sp.]
MTNIKPILKSLGFHGVTLKCANELFYFDTKSCSVLIHF